MYPQFDGIFLRLMSLFRYMFFLIFISFLTIIFHSKNYPEYYIIKSTLEYNTSSDIRNKNIFQLYGNFEQGVTESRFYLYAIATLFTIICMFKRIYFGGFSNLKYVLISFLLSISLVVFNVVYFILTIILVLFSYYSYITNKDFYKKHKFKLTNTVFYIQFIINIAFGLFVIKVIYDSIRLCIHLYKIFKNLKEFQNNEETNVEKEIEFNFTGKERYQHKLIEYIKEGIPRYLFYSLYKSDKLININNNIELKVKKEEEVQNEGEDLNNQNQINDKQIYDNNNDGNFNSENQKDSSEVIELKNHKHPIKNKNNN